MIIARAPLRISFVGGGTDLPVFYNHNAGCVISTAIDKFVYIAVNKAFRAGILLKYSTTEDVVRPADLKHTRVRAALLDLGIKGGLEISSLADISSKSGLGSSSSFSVALIKVLNAFLGKSIDNWRAAELACRLEMDILKEPIGKQDQYAAAFGGINILHFNKGGKVKVEPVVLDPVKKTVLEKHMLLFFTGQFRDTSNILKEQGEKVGNKISVYKDMAGLVIPFRDALISGNIKKAGDIMTRNWQLKKTLASSISNNSLDQLYEAGIAGGAFGGKILGAGGGGSLFFLAAPKDQAMISKKVERVAQDLGFKEFKRIPVKLFDGKAEILFKGGEYNNKSGYTPFLS